MSYPISFNAKNHTYTSSTGASLTPVSHIIKSLCEEFPSEMASKAVAKRDGVSAESVLASWDKKRDDSAAWGTLVHKWMESKITSSCGSGGCIIETPILTRIADEFTAIFPDLHKCRDVFCEEILGDFFCGIAGTADLVIYSGKTAEIWDFKTNESIDYTSKYNKWLKSPVSCLPDCSYSKYCLQLSMYAWMLGLKGYKVTRLGIIHIASDRVTPESVRLSVIPMPFLHSDVALIFNKHRYGQLKTPVVSGSVQPSSSDIDW